MMLAMQRRAHPVPVAFLLLLLLAGCQRTDSPNVLLITLDTTRADRLGVMGDAEARTPVLDALAARGVLFERAYASVPLTLPSHTTILTGLEPNLHGVHDNGRFTVPASLETIAERLSARGYVTAAFLSAFVLDAIFGLDQGFAVYDDDTDPEEDPLRFTVPSRRGQEITERALAWLARERRRPFFLWAHYYDVHAPRRPPPPFDALGDPYAGELAYVDAQVGQLLEGIERAAGSHETLILVVGDHGESLGEHDEFTHGLLAYDSSLHVPLMVAGAGFPAGMRSRAFVRTLDVAPTILAALGEPPLTRSNGTPLQQRLAEDAAPDALGYFECSGPEYGWGWARIGGVRSKRWKYTAEPQPVELYDVLADPHETRNRAADEPALVARLDQRYAELRVSSRTPSDSLQRIPLDAQEKLAALGYITSFEPPDSKDRPDPREWVGLLGWISGARNLARRGRVRDSIELLEAFASRPVARPLALRSLAPIYQLVGRRDDAVAAYESLAELTQAPGAEVDLAAALVRAGRAEEALPKLEEVAKRSQEFSARLRLVRAGALVHLDRPEEAERDVSAVLSRDPGHDAALALASRMRAARDGAAAEIPRLQQLLAKRPNAARLVQTRRLLARLLHAEGRDTEAVQLLETGAESSPEDRALLAEIAAKRGSLEKAAALYRSALAESPASWRYRHSLAELYDQLGRPVDALALYAEMVAVSPTDATLFVDRGATLFALGRLAEAEADYRRALELDDTLPEAAFNLALIELAAGQEEEAEAHLLRAVELRPNYAKAHFHLARILGKRGDPRGAFHAEEAARASTELGPTRAPGRAAGARPGARDDAER
jgi:arylsulfatase A-like enzyme/tetratricopeptide (TPR) repeat protein